MTDRDIYNSKEGKTNVEQYDHPEVLGAVAVLEAVNEEDNFGQWEAQLRQKKETNERESMDNGKMHYIGTFRDIKGSGSWYGAISPFNRIKHGELTQDRIDRAILPEYADEPNNLSRFFIKVVEKAKIRCIDGRGKLGYQSHSAEMYNEELGPQVAGGTFGAACSWRLAEGGTAESFTNADIEQDTEYLAEVSRTLGYTSGGHVDDRSPIFDAFDTFEGAATKQGVHLEASAQDFLQASIDKLSADGKTGCGAIDGIVDDLNHLATPEDIGSIEALTKTILDQTGRYNQDHFDGVIASAVKLQGAKGYFKKKVVAIKRLIERKRNSVTVLSGNHNEVVLNINYVEGTTFHTNEFSARNDGAIQAFNYDIWHTFQMGKKLYPDDPRMASKYIHARTALAVATAKRLMADSVALVFRLP